MGTLGNSVFRLLMGWIRTLSAEIWNTASHTDRTTALAWIGSHWKMLALVLCAAGLVIDLVVYLFRWQPYRVWRSFLARRRNRDDSFAEDEADEISEVTEDQSWNQWEETEAEKVYDAGWSHQFQEQAGFQDDFAAENRVSPEGTTARFEQAIRTKRKRRITNILSEGQDMEYDAPDQLIDQNEAYRRPVYPKSWAASEDEE